jgi:O-antigen/teichoic acid export membrane protein
VSVLKKLFQQTFIYGLATVLPRALGIVLIPLYTSVLAPSSFGVYATLMAYIILGNVLLSYGMETAFFRFINKEGIKKSLVQSTALTSIALSSIVVLILVYVAKNYVAKLIGFNVRYVVWSLQILVLDALVIIPFVWYRANEKPLKYALIKILSVCINLGCNLFFFLGLPLLDTGNLGGFWSLIGTVEDPVDFIFRANR